MAREMQRKRAVVREEIERSPAWPRVLSHQNPVFALIEEGTRLLSGPRRGEVFHTILHNLDNLGNLPMGEQNLRRQALVAPYPGVVAEQDAFGSERRRYSREHVRSRGLQPRREQLRDDPRSVLVDDE